MNKEKSYKDLLLKEHEDAISALDPYQKPEDNLDWLWTSVKKLGQMDDEMICSLSQLALHYGRSSLEQASISFILNEPDKTNQQRIESIIEYLDS